MVDSSSVPLEKIGQEEIYKAAVRKVCQGQGDQALATMTRLVQAIMLLEGIGARGESDMDRQVGPLRRAGMDYFGYNDTDEFMMFVRDVCLVLLGVFFGTVVWLMWDKLTAASEPEEEPHAEPAEAQQQVEPAEAQQQVELAEAHRIENQQVNLTHVHTYHQYNQGNRNVESLKSLMRSVKGCTHG